MASGLFQPVGQKRLTNIAVVRTKKAGTRFEIACYKNTVLAWRSGAEKDIDEVLQSKTVYENVSKGVLAKDKNLQQAFGTTDQEEVCKIILKVGEVQVSDKERSVQIANLVRDVAATIVEKCVNPETGRPHPLQVIEQALRDVHFNADTRRGAKQQALEVLPVLRTQLPIERARMRLRLVAPDKGSLVLDKVMKESRVEVESFSEGGGERSIVVLVDPGAYRMLCDSLSAIGGAVDVLALAARKEGDVEASNVRGAGQLAQQHYGGGNDNDSSRGRVGKGFGSFIPAARTEEAIELPVKEANGSKCATGSPVATTGRTDALTSATAPGAEFANRDELKAHLKSTWHCVNLGRKSRGEPMVSKEEAEGLALLEEMEREHEEF